MKSYGRKRYGRRRSYGRRKNRYLKKYIRKAVRSVAETKHITYPYNNIGGGSASMSSVSYGGSSIVGTLATGVTQGVQLQQRVGTKIWVRGIKVYLALQPGDNTNYLRLLIVKPKGRSDQTSNANFIQQVFTGAASGSTQWANPVDTDLYEVFMDKTVTGNYWATGQAAGVGDPETAPTIYVFKKWVKINRYIHWPTNPSSAPVEDLLWIGISDSALAPNPGAVAGYIKMYYKDI